MESTVHYTECITKVSGGIGNNQSVESVDLIMSLT